MSDYFSETKTDKKKKISDLANYPFIEINKTASTGVPSTEDSVSTREIQQVWISHSGPPGKTDVSLLPRSPKGCFSPPVHNCNESPWLWGKRCRAG